jgi:hypothetical protein
VDFIFMLTRKDRTVEDAEHVVRSLADLGVSHIGFKDVGVPPAVLERIVACIRARGATSYLEVVSTTPASVVSSLATGARLGVDCILGGTDLAAAESALGGLDRYFPFPAGRSAIRRSSEVHRRTSSVMQCLRARAAAEASISSPIAPPTPIRSSSFVPRAAGSASAA